LKRLYIELALVFVFLCALSAGVTLFVNRQGWTLYYGDAEAHLNIARRIVDSRTPGYDQIGTVWLPLPHILTLGLVGNDGWWRSGLAGAIPSSACFALAGFFLFAGMRRATQSSAAALAALGLFAFNPNLLYLQSTPMTEPISLACWMALLYFSVRFRQTQSVVSVVGAGLAGLAASMARYEGWFAIPFAALYILIAARRRRLVFALAFFSIAMLGPLYWLAHNWWLYGNPLEFFNGPYSARSIYQRGLSQHMQPYPGDHNWGKAWLFFRTAARLCAGWGAVLAAAAGLFMMAWRRIFWPVLLAGLLPIFYLWSMHSGGTPIYVPGLWFNSYYNTRYGLAALPLVAILGGSLALAVTQKFRSLAAAAIVLAGLAPWLIHSRPDDWICWKESQVNSETRRTWTKEAASFLAAEYKPGTGILTSFGDLAGIFREAGIPLREVLHEGNQRDWLAATRRPDMFLHTRWAVTMSGDEADAAIQRATATTGPRYHLVRSIMIRAGPAIEIYKLDEP
jgi:hypothetical protein